MSRSSPFEDVFTVDDWYDGPRAGFALYHGEPHHYRSLYLDSDDWIEEEDRFELVPVTRELLEAGLEASAIFNRWDAVRQRAQSTGQTEILESGFGALPEERERYLASRKAIAAVEVRGHPLGFVVRGRFELGCRRVQWWEESSARPSSDAS